MNERAAASLAEPQTRVAHLPSRQSARPRDGRIRRYWLAVAAAALAISGGIGWWLQTGVDTTSYVSVPVTRGPITRAVTATGTVNPQLTIIVGTYVSGVIQELYCDYNTRVEKGQLCAKIDPRPFQSQVDQAKASLAVAKAQRDKSKASLGYAQRVLERSAKLLPSSAVSKDAFDNALSNYEQAKAQVAFDEATIEQRQAALDAAQVNLDYTNIVSPVDGVVVSRSVTQGQTVAASFQTPTLFLIATDLTKMQVDANVSESDIGGIKLGDKSMFTVDAFPKRTFDGVVTQVRQSPQTVQNVVTYDVVVTAENQDLALRPGMTAATRIIVDHREMVLRVPNAALRYRPREVAPVRDNEHTRVFILREGNPAVVRVTTGLSDESFTEIVGGDLQPGDAVISAEQDRTASPRTAPRLRF